MQTAAGWMVMPGAGDSARSHERVDSFGRVVEIQARQVEAGQGSGSLSLQTGCSRVTHSKILAGSKPDPVMNRSSTGLSASAGRIVRDEDVGDCPDAKVDDVESVGRCDDRVEVDLDDLRHQIGQLAEAHEQCLQRGVIDGGGSSISIEERRDSQGSHHFRWIPGE